MALRAYTSPGVSVTETISPALAPLFANPAVVAIVGAGRGEQLASERLVLSGTDEVTLKHTGLETASVVVKSAATGLTVDAGAYVVTTTDPDAGVDGDETSTLKRFASPTTAPVAANTGTGTLTSGDIYTYAVSFVNAQGETGVGPSSNPVTIAGTGGVNLTAIPLGPTGTTARNVYRAKTTAGVAGTLHLVSTIGNNTATTLDNETVTDAVANAAVTPKQGIASGDTVVISYDYTDKNYFEPTFFDDYDDLVDKYGEPFDSNGNISSKLSFAARLAFQNGASEIVALASEADNDQSISDAFAKLEDVGSIRLISAASGSASVHSALAAHITNMNSQGYYRMGVVGRDSTASAVTAATLRSAAQAMNNEAIVLLSPANFVLANPITGRDMNVGGQYAAAGVLGMFASRDIQVPLTRKTLSGFIGLGERRTATEAALDNAAGLFVIIDAGGFLQVRHQVTTAVNNVNTAEASVVRAKYEMAHRLRQTLDGSIVGNVLPVEEAPLIVQSVVSGVLDQLLVEGAVSRYGNVKARLLETDPTTMEVRFEYRPSYPINNVVVRFTINTSTGDFQLGAI